MMRVFAVLLVVFGLGGALRAAAPQEPAPQEIGPQEAAPQAAAPQEDLANIAALDGNLIVSGGAGTFADADAVAAKIAAVAGVRAVVPVLEGLTLVSTSNDMTGLLMRGVRSDDLSKIPYLAAVATPDNLSSYRDGPGIAIGGALSQRLNFKIGDNVTLSFTRPDGDGADGPQISATRFIVAMVFSSGVSTFDDNVIYMPLEQAQSSLGRSNAVSRLMVYLDNPADLVRAKTSIADAVSEPLDIVDWRQRHDEAVRRLEHAKPKAP